MAKGDFIPNALLLQWEQQEVQLQGKGQQPMPFVSYLLAPARKLFWGLHSAHLIDLKKKMTALDKKYFVHNHDFKTNQDVLQFQEPLTDKEGKPLPNQQPQPKLIDGMKMEDYNKEFIDLMKQGITVR